MREIIDIKSIPFDGGVITSIPRQLVKSGKFSTFQNFRWRHPSFEKRYGQSRLHTTTDNVNNVWSMYQYRKKNAEIHFYSQFANGQVQEATNNPPSITIGDFGSEILAATANSKSASWSTMNDRCLYSDSVRQHQIYMGSTNEVLMFNVYKATTAIPRIPTEGNDYTNEVNDGLSNTVAIVDSLDTLANYDCIFICTPIKAKSLTFTIPNVNTTSSTLTLKYWNGNLTTVTNTDGTSLSGATMGQSGIISWTPPSDEIPHYMFGISGFWYQLSVSATLSATVRISEVTFNANWQSITNVWDGVLVDAIEAQVYDTSTTSYKIFGSTSVDLMSLATSDYCYFSSLDPLDGFYIDVGATPNIISATFTGSSDVSFYDGGTGDDYLKCPQNTFLTSGFEVGMSITISGTTSNNWTATIISISNNTIYVSTGTVTAENNKSATITFSSSNAISTVSVWTGSAWSNVTSMTDGSAGLTKSGFVHWNRNSVIPSKIQFNSSGYYAYWYRFSCSGRVSSKVNLGIQALPYFDISDLGYGVSNGSWKGRSLLTFTKYPHYVYISAVDEPMFLNGSDYGLIEVGDGRTNKVLSIKPFYNEVLVWQEEKGREGGCTTLIEGYAPTGAGSFGKLVLSNRIGILNSKCSVIVEGVTTEASGLNKNSTIAFWLSRYGVVACEGTTIWVISNDISNYFDTTKTECIRKGYEDKHWLEYDSTYKILRIGLVSGSSATEPNIFPVFDLQSKSWGFDVMGQTITCMTEVEASSGNITILQLAGSNDGFVYQTNNGTTDNNIDITTTAIMEIDGEGKRIKLRGEMLRVKSQSAGDVIRSVDVDCVNLYTEDTITLPLQAINTGEEYRRHRWPEVITGNHISLKWSSTNLLSLYDLGVEIYEIQNTI